MAPSNPHYRRDPGFGRLYILGAGGFGREVAWLAEQSWDTAIERIFLVDREEYLADEVAGIRVELLQDIPYPDDARYVVAIGDPAVRRRGALRCEAAGLQAAILTHPRAEISRSVRIAAGAIICAGVTITTDIVIGAHAHINLDCTIGHDVRIGDFSTLAPGVHVSGNVHIGEGVYLGTGASLIHGNAAEPLLVGDGALVAAAACVTRSVQPGAMVAGVPAVRKR